MPIKIPKELPAFKVLSNENIFIMNDERAMSQDIRPLKIVILNLMPKKNSYRKSTFEIFIKYTSTG